MDNNVSKWNEIAGKVSSTFPIELIDFEKYSFVDSEILDFGCGEGRFLNYLQANKYCKVTGCDASIEMCRISAGICQYPILHLDSLEFPPELSQRKFDIIVLVAVLSSIIPTSARVELIKKLSKILKHSGKLIFCDFGVTSSNLYIERYKNSIAEPYTFRTQEGILIHHFTYDELIQLFTPNFKILEYKTVNSKSIHGNDLIGHILIGQKHFPNE